MVHRKACQKRERHLKEADKKDTGSLSFQKGFLPFHSFISRDPDGINCLIYTTVK